MARFANWICALTQGNDDSRDDLRQRPAALRVPTAATAAVAVEREVQVLERIIAWQARRAGWHLGEGGRLRDLARRSMRPEGPAAASAPGRTISGETTRQPGGCGQSGGA